MHTRMLTYVVLFALGLSTFFGLFLSAAGHEGHQSHCPFVQAEMSLCTTVLDHIDHWQVAFAAVLTLIVFVALCVLAYALPLLFVPKRVRLRDDPAWHAPARPTLYQELFARGLLNPRAP